MSEARGRLRGPAPVMTGHVQQRVHAAAAVSATSVPDWQPTTVGLPMQIVQPPDVQVDQERACMARGRPAGRPVTTSRLSPRAVAPLPFVWAPAGTVDLDDGIVDCIGALRDLKEMPIHRPASGFLKHTARNWPKSVSNCEFLIVGFTL